MVAGVVHLMPCINTASPVDQALVATIPDDHNRKIYVSWNTAFAPWRKFPEAGL